jgi:RNA polymerase sigma factor (sigma-70 family)
VVTIFKGIYALSSRNAAVIDNETGFVTLFRFRHLTPNMYALKLSAREIQQLPDDVVVQRVLSGEKELFELLLRRYNQKLYRVIRSYLRQSSDIEDAMQDAYLKAFNKLDQFRGDSSFSTWLIRIGINEALQRIKKDTKVKLLHDQNADLTSNDIIQLPDLKDVNPEKIAIGKEVKSLIEHAIDELPEKYRVIYVLKEIEGMETQELCACLGVSEANAKVRLHRAKHLMKETLLRLSADSEIFEFGSSRCDALVSRVMSNI